MSDRKVPDDWVVMAEKICPVCTKKHDHSGELLLHRRMRSIPEDKRVTGWGFCKECQALKDAGYLAVVGIDPRKSEATGDQRVKQEGAWRTGKIVHIKEEAARQIFTLGPEFEGPHNPYTTGWMFADDVVVEQLIAREQERVERDGTPTPTAQEVLAQAEQVRQNTSANEQPV